MERVSELREPCLVCMGREERATSSSGGQDRLSITGILNLDKPSGLTSHDVVDRIRRASGVRRVGHAGTLDPAASGVLLICLGQATRVSRYLMEGRKRYDALVRLGIDTDTGDAEGRVTRTMSTAGINRERTLAALHLFHGRIKQVPPLYSALKHNGRPLYQLAREGVHVERPAREVEVYDLRLLDWAPPSARLLVECSKGTYVRALARDLGQELGTGAHLESLTRLACGPYLLEDSTSLEEAEHLFSTDEWHTILHPFDEALLPLEAFQADARAADRIRQGQQVEGPTPSRGPVCRVYDPNRRLIALLHYDEQSRLWQPRKVFDRYGATA
jgi:tRNA pseudouridine55 synthase